MTERHNNVGFLTIARRSSLARAKVLFASIRRAKPDARLWLMVSDDDADLDLDAEGFDGVSRVNGRTAVGEERYRRMAYSYGPIEFRAALKPFAIRALLAEGLTQCHYFDPEAFVLRSLDDVIAKQAACNVTLLPNLIDELPADGKWPDEQTWLRAGAFNLGYIGLRANAETTRLLDWWAERLETRCDDDVTNGLYLDQRWMDLVPGLFDGVAIVCDPRLNVGYWTLAGRELDPRDATRLADGSEITFMQFAGFDPYEPLTFAPDQTRVCVEPDSPLHYMLTAYAAQLFLAGHAAYLRLGYGHDYDEYGCPIDACVRLAIRREPDLASGWLPLEAALDGANKAPPTFPFRYTRYVRALYEARTDVQRAFPDPLGSDAVPFAAWLRESGVREANPRLVGNAIRDQEIGDNASNGAVRIVAPLHEQRGVAALGHAVLSAIRVLGRPASFVDVSEIASAQAQPGADTWRGPSSRAPVATIVCMSETTLGTLGPLDLGQRDGAVVGAWWGDPAGFDPERCRNAAPFAEIWVPSQFSLEVFSRESRIPATLIPPVVAVGRADSRARRHRDDFTFLCMFDYVSVFERKNPLAVIDAFRRAFPQGTTRVKLVLKTANAHCDSVNARSLRALASEDARIVVIENKMNSAETAGIISSCDAYVSLHRSVGFGMAIAEAMALGKTVIATGWSANMDYMSAMNSIVVPYRLVPIVRPHGPHRVGEFWADPDVEAAARAMRSACDGDGLDAMGSRARETIRTQFSASAVAARIAGRLEVVSTGFGPTADALRATEVCHTGGRFQRRGARCNPEAR